MSSAFLKYVLLTSLLPVGRAVLLRGNLKENALMNLSSSILHSLNSHVQNSSLEEPSKDTVALMKALEPCKVCEKHRRFGEPNDGGYVMCDDDLQLGQLQAAYSYGISGFDGWGNEVSKEFGVPVFEYDCTDKRRPQACPTCDLRFTLECIQGESADAKDKFATLSQQLARNGHHQVNEGTLLLKIDVEGAEWQVFAEEPTENLKKFREIVVEFHHLDNVDQHQLYLRAVKNIQDAGFVVDHIHGNNCCPLVSFGTYRVPAVLEVSYVRRPDGNQKCMPHTAPLPEDAANLPSKPELQSANLA